MLSADDVRERQVAARRQAIELQDDIRLYRLAKAYFAERDRSARRFAPLSPTQQRWRGLRDPRDSR